MTKCTIEKWVNEKKKNLIKISFCGVLKKYYKEYSVTRQDGQKQTFYLLLWFFYIYLILKSNLAFQCKIFNQQHIGYLRNSSYSIWYCLLHVIISAIRYAIQLVNSCQLEVH